MMYVQHFFKSPFELFEELSEFYEEKKLEGMKLSRNRRYEIFREFGQDRLARKMRESSAEHLENFLQRFDEILFYDYCLREKPKSRPAFGAHSQLDKRSLKEIYTSFGVKREEEGMHDMERFSFDPVATAESGEETGKSCYILFSYEQREAMYGGAIAKQISM